MRKILIFTAALLMIGGNTAFSSETSNEVGIESSVSSPRKVRVKMIKSIGKGGATATSSKEGIYDPEENTLTVDGRTYPVQKMKLPKENVKIATRSQTAFTISTFDYSPAK